MAYNVADPAGLVSIRELATLFTQVHPEQGLQLIFNNEADARSYNQARRQGLDSARLAGLGWRAQVPLAEGLKRMVTDLTDRVQTSPDPGH